mmetsp:Transcript_10360/g.13473  ORF Transcript_10360/g.13473 Transcript_10360/m.13473 type:complete len:109 (+) Transcript_10360:650-976(+)
MVKILAKWINERTCVTDVEFPSSKANKELPLMSFGTRSVPFATSRNVGKRSRNSTTFLIRFPRSKSGNICSGLSDTRRHLITNIHQFGLYKSYRNNIVIIHKNILNSC